MMLVQSNSSCVAPSGGEYPVSSPLGFVTRSLLSFFKKYVAKCGFIFSCYIERAAILMCRESVRVVKLSAEVWRVSRTEISLRVLMPGGVCLLSRRSVRFDDVVDRNVDNFSFMYDLVCKFMLWVAKKVDFFGPWVRLFH